MPVGVNSADVVISNCVLNLLPKKDKIFNEIFRVLKPNGHFCISDVVLSGELPAKLKEAAEMYVGCVSGAIQKEEYMVEIFRAGFTKVKIEKETPIIIPDEVLEKYLNPEEIKKLKAETIKILSVTVTGVKPGSSCGCGSGCC